MESLGSGATGPGADPPQVLQDSIPSTECLSLSASGLLSPISEISTVFISHDSPGQSEDIPQVCGKEDDLHERICSNIGKCRENLHKGMKEAIMDAESFSREVAYSYDPARLFSWVGLAKNTQVQTQAERLSDMLVQTTCELSELADAELAGFSSALFSLIGELEKRCIDRVECKERDMMKESRLLLQDQKAMFQKELEDLKAAHMLYQDEHKKALEESNTQQEKILADLQDQHEKALADDKQRHDQELIDLQTKFEKEAAARDAQFLSDVSAANNKTSEEMALRKKFGAQLNNSFALSWTLRQELARLETRLSSVLENKNADDEWRRQENERREAEAREREQHRHRCEEEAKRKEEELHACHQTQMETKQSLDRATEEVDRLKEALKKEAEHCLLLESKLASTRAQILSLQEDVSDAESIKESDDAERRVLDHKREDEAKQHEQDRVRREAEVAKKEAGLCFSHRLQLKAKQKELDDAMRKIDQLETKLKEETDQGAKLLKDCVRLTQHPTCHQG
ncbi:hypothetical protein DENSPDRAFT_196682 [Dentipellis sp. KUC8613]|nr:hypothetical protein DENSPDRAFT_196682 [Dentipellis sp. KUC8613]